MALGTFCRGVAPGPDVHPPAPQRYCTPHPARDLRNRPGGGRRRTEPPCGSCRPVEALTMARLISNSFSSRSPSAGPGWHNSDINQFLEPNQHDRFKLCVGRRTKPSRGFGMANVSKATLPRCILFSNASTLPGTSRAITFFRSNRRCSRSIRLSGAGAASALLGGNAFSSSGVMTPRKPK